MSQSKDGVYEAKKYRVILDFPFDWSPYGDFITSVLIGLVLYFFGLIISFFWGFSDIYWGAYLFKHIAFAVFLACYTFVRSRAALAKSLEQIRPCFRVSKSKYDSFVSEWLKIIFSKKGWIGSWLVFSAAIVVLLIMLYKPEQIGNWIPEILPQLPFRRILDPIWFTNPVFPKLVVLLLFLVVGALPLSACIWAAINFLRLFFCLADFPVEPQPASVNILLRSLTSLLISISFVYFLLTGSTSIVLFDRVSVEATLVTLLIGSIGIAGFIVPQIAFYRIMQKSSQALASVFLSGAHVGSRDVGDSKSKSLDYYMEIANANLPNNLWVFDYGHVFILALGELLPIALQYAYSALLAV